MTTTAQDPSNYSWMNKKVIIKNTSPLLFLIPANPSVVYFTVTKETGDRGSKIQVNNYDVDLPKTEFEFYNG